MIILNKLSELFNINGDKSPMQSLGDAITVGNNKKALKLIPQCKDIDNNSGIVPPLLLAISNKNITVVNALLEADANPNICRTFTKFKPLELALLHDFFEGAISLVEKGADVKGITHKEKDAFLNVTLSKATTTSKPKNSKDEESYLRLIQAMVNKGADVNKRNKGGLTPLEQLMPISQENKFLKDIAKTLVKGGAKLNPRDAQHLEDCGVSISTKSISTENLKNKTSPSR